MDRNGDCLGSQWLSLGVAGPEAGSSTSGLYEKGGGCRETRWKQHPHCLVQDTPRYLALSPVCHYLPLWGWLSQVLSSLAGFFLETEAETPGVLSKTRQRSKKTASQWNRRSISSVVTPPLCSRAPDLGSHLDSPFAPGTPKFSSCSPSLCRLSPTSPCPP